MNIRNLICIKKIRTDCSLECKCHFHNYDACGHHDPDGVYKNKIYY